MTRHGICGMPKPTLTCSHLTCRKSCFLSTQTKESYQIELLWT